MPAKNASKPLMWLGLPIVIILMIGSLLLYVRGASVPEKPAPPFGAVAKNDSLVIATDACQGLLIKRVIVRKSRGIITSSKDPVIWDYSPATIAASVTTDDLGAGLAWPGLKTIGDDEGVTVELTVMQDATEDVLASTFSGGELRETGAVVRGRSASKQMFENFSARAC